MWWHRILTVILTVTFSINDRWLLMMICDAAPDIAFVPDPCAHEMNPNVRKPKQAQDKDTFFASIKRNATHLYQFSNYNYTQINQIEAYRKLIINLEPCEGVVYLFVRKTRRCFPNPYSCINLETAEKTGAVPAPHECQWTHFMSVIDGTRDGAPTFFEIPLASTQYFISIYAKETSSYTLTFLTDIGQMPRPGKFGDLSVVQTKYREVMVSWDAANLVPHGQSNIARYWIYTAPLMADVKRTNAAVFLTKNKIMNTVCGLKNHTHRAYGPPVLAENCQGTRCNATIEGIATKGTRYVVNVVAQSESGFELAYAGLVYTAEWEVKNLAISNRTLQAVGAVAGGVLAMASLSYLVIQVATA